MALKRRAFLQRAGILAALGLSEASFGLLSQRYAQALAQPSQPSSQPNRKLALLVGINQYPEAVCDYTAKGSALSGCLTDLELQSELLQHRFGFAPSDILVLSDQAATREGIETAFLKHLIQQATPGDLVLFHFSGLGSQVQLDGGWQNSLVPIDGLLPTAERPLVQDLMQETLELLLRALPTRRVITVLDAGYTRLGHSRQGSLRIRSRPNAPAGVIAEAELEFQAQLRRQFGSQRAQRPGLVLQAGADRQIVAETQHSGFSAGLFTYALTQQLWQAPLMVSFSQATAAVQQTTGAQQQPVATGFEPGMPSALGPEPLAETAATAAGVIRARDSEGKLSLWLAGLPAAVLENQTGSLFAADAELLQLRSREGLVVKARSLSPAGLAPGMLVREVLRVLPRNVNLMVALDSDLKRIERVDATSAFAAIPRISAVALGEQATDLLFGRPKLPLLAALPTLPTPPNASSAEPAAVQDAPVQDAPAAPLSSSYGLFYPGRSAIPSTLNSTSEAVKTAVTRLTPQLKTLLSMKLLRLTQNSGSSKLAVRATLNLVAPESKPLLQQATRGALPALPADLSPSAPASSTLSAPTLPASGQIQYVLQNNSADPLYFLLMGLNAKATPVMLYSTTPIAAGETVATPAENGASWLLQPTTGLAETYLIFSAAPFAQTQQLLAESAQEPDRILALNNPLEVAEAILQDLHQVSLARTAELITTFAAEILADSYALDVDAWVSFSFGYQVVA